MLFAPPAHVTDPASVKVASIDQLNGPLSNVGEQLLASLKLGVDDANARSWDALNGTRYELSMYGNKPSARDSLSTL